MIALHQISISGALLLIPQNRLPFQRILCESGLKFTSQHSTNQRSWQRSIQYLLIRCTTWLSRSLSGFHCRLQSYTAAFIEHKTWVTLPVWPQFEMKRCVEQERSDPPRAHTVSHILVVTFYRPHWAVFILYRNEWNCGLMNILQVSALIPFSGGNRRNGTKPNRHFCESTSSECPNKVLYRGHFFHHVSWLLAEHSKSS